MVIQCLYQSNSCEEMSRALSPVGHDIDIRCSFDILDLKRGPAYTKPLLLITVFRGRFGSVEFRT